MCCWLCCCIRDESDATVLLAVQPFGMQAVLLASVQNPGARGLWVLCNHRSLRNLGCCRNHRRKEKTRLKTISNVVDYTLLVLASIGTIGLILELIFDRLKLEKPVLRQESLFSEAFAFCGIAYAMLAVLSQMVKTTVFFFQTLSRFSRKLW